MTDIELPKDWTLAHDDPSPGFSVLESAEPHKYRATIDWKNRTYRLGVRTFGEKLTAKKYKGRHWKTNLVEDAVAYLCGMILLP